jgi:hypothetical protein
MRSGFGFQLGLAVALLFLAGGLTAYAQKPYVGANVNMVTGTRLGDGDPFATKQNESSMAVSSLNANHLLAGANDYRLVAISQSPDIPGDGLGNGDAWVGLYYSIDKGMTWRSTVLGGCPLNMAVCNNPLMSNIKGKEFAADPTIRSAPYGIFLLSFIAAYRSSSANGVIAVQRFFDRPEVLRPDELPYRQVDSPFIIDTGTSGQFKDKSWIATDIPGRPFNAGTCSIPGYAQPVPAFNSYVAFSNFVGQSDGNPHPQILVARSTDCGRTFEKPVKVSQSLTSNSGATVAVDPVSGDVYVVWRQFSYGTSDPDAVYFARSTDGGNKFGPSVKLTNFIPFDQGTNGTQFRTNAFPTMAVSVDGGGQSYIHVAFSARKTVDGDARIAMMTSSNGGSLWGPLTYVDDWTSDPINPINPGRGHQFQPAMAFAGGKLMIGWFDQRYDQTSGLLRCPAGRTCRGVQDYEEVRVGEGVFAGATSRMSDTDPRLGIVFTKFLTDGTSGLTRKHTIDFFAAMGAAGPSPTFTSARVSRYRYGNRAAASKGAQPVVQLQYNVPNRPIFVNNKASFIGDYADITVQAMSPTGNTSQPYKFNNDPTIKAVFHATFTDNRNVIPPRIGDWSNRTPISVITTNPDGSVGGVQLNTNCVPGQEGTQNQDIFTAQIGEDLGTFAPVNAKTLNSSTPRGFVVGVQNLSDQNRTYCLSIANQPPGGYASFLQDLTATQEVTSTVLPRSSITRTVWAKSTLAGAGINVNVYGSACSDLPSPRPLSARLTVIQLNPDPNSPKATTTDGALNPDGTPKDTANNDLSDVSVRDVPIKNTELTNTELTNTELTNTELTNTELTNTELTNTELTNTELTNTELTNTELTNTELTNTELTNTELTNTELTNTELTNTELTNGAVVDARFNLANNGNTDVALNLKTLLRDNTVPAGYKLQLAVRRIAISPYTRNCKFYPSQVNAQVVNVPAPRIENLGATNLGDFLTLDSAAENATIPLLPNERAHVVIRIVGPSQLEARQFGANALKMLAVGPDKSRTVIPLIIKTLALPQQTAGTTFSLPLDSFGGLGARTWSPSPDLPFPAGLSINAATGVLTGNMTAGAYTVKIRVSDQSIPVQSDVQTLILSVKLATQTLTITGLPASGTPLTYGTAPTSFNVGATSTSGLPVSVTAPGATNACTAGGATVSVVSAGTCTVTVSQDGSPIYAPSSQTSVYPVAQASQTITFNVPTTKTYGDAPFAVSATASSALSASVASATPSVCQVSGGTVTITGAGSCSLTASQAGNVNYLAAPDAVKQITIAKAALTVTAASAARVYGSANPPLTGTLAGVVNGDNITATYSTTAVDISPAGIYPIAASLADPAGRLANYLLTSTDGTLTITKGIIAVTANSYSRLYGAPNPAFTGTITGVVAGDGITGSFSTTATQASGVGSYAIVPALVDPNGKAGNYTVTITTGTLAVNPAPLVVAAANAAKVYGDPLPAFGITFSGFVNGEGPAALGGALIFGTAATPTSNAGSYFVAPSGLTSANYAISYVPGTLIITRATPAFSGLSAPTVSAGAVSTSLTGTVALGTMIPTGSVNVTLNGVTVAAAITPVTGAFSASFATGSLATGAYTVTYAYSGDINFNGISSTTPLRVEGWQPAANMSQARSSFAAVKLQDGTVLLIAGNGASGAPTATADLYNPATGVLAPVGNIPNKAAGHTATLLADGRVVVAGGGNSSTEIYSPASKTFSSAGGLGSNRSFHTATLLGNGLILIAGGSDSAGKTTNTSILYNPANGSYTNAANMSAARENHTATLLPDGRILLAGGRQGSGSSYLYLASTEIYNPATNTFTSGPDLAQSRAYHTATLMSGKVMLVGGSNGTADRSTTEVYTPVSGAAGTIAAGGSLGTARRNHTATLLSDGRLLIAGGDSGNTRLAGCESYTGSAFSAAPSMLNPRSLHTAVLLNDGRMLASGGLSVSGVSVASMELFVSP